ncbi:MAG: 3-phosphoglycerate dehydrogenase family protein [Akkermansia sp.]|nr:3-phosphoglycerate dehydrogenase family protein [Akkermansia sp.]
MKILIPTKLDKAAAGALTAAGYEVVQNDSDPIDVQAAANPDAVGLIVRSEKVTPAVIDSMPTLKCIIRAGAGYDNIDYVYARSKGIDVMNTPGANSNAVAEEVIAMILAAYRYVVPADVTTRAGEWNKKKYMGRELTRKTVGILGLGNIGRLLVKRLQGFECTVLGYDHFLSKQRALNIGATPAEINEIFANADIISLHVPGGPATKNLVNERLINMMKDGAMIINCSRYGVVDEDAIRAARAAGKNIIYCTDVHPKDTAAMQPSADVADVMLPHLGANTREANKLAAMRAASQMEAYFTSGDTSCVINAEKPTDLSAAHLQLAAMLGKLCYRAGGGKPIRKIECTFYNNLRSYRKWFTPWILQGAVPGAEQGLMPAAAEQSLREHGIVFKAREPMDDKLYDDALTLDIFMEENGEQKKTSVRGMVVDGEPVVSRINNFNHLYAGLSGNTIFLRYADRPGVIATVSQIISQANINIENMVAPRDAASGDSLAVIKTDKPINNEQLDLIARAIAAKQAFALSL